MYASVIVDIAHSNVDRVFEYRVPEQMDIRAGARVLVPFGKSKQVEGFVMKLAKTAEYDGGLKEIIRPLEDFCALTAEQIELAAYIKEKYNTTLARALRLMIPAQLRGGRVKEKTRNFCFPEVRGDAYERAVASLLKKDDSPKYPNQLLVLEALAGCEEGIAAAEFSPSAVKALAKKGWIRVQKARTARKPYAEDVPLIADYELTEKQKEILEEIQTGESRYFLLHGVTGSGKTEIYIRVIKDCLARGKTAIMLVPEISLTPQTYLFLKQRFSEQIAVFHSGLSAGERYDEWMKVKRGEAKIVLGARSAVFAPLESIGAIIIDEQHETSYKSDQYPKYTAGEVAKKRCGLSGAKLILGSATPDIGTYYAAAQGEYKLLEMPDRLFGLCLPGVEVVDMREELKNGNRSMISGRLYDELERTFAAGGQAMLFLNRRGYSTFVMCRSCGYAVQCDSCDVTMTYHKTKGELKCHYCGKTKPLETVCPQCGKPHLKYFGTGTQQIEEQVKQMFPGVRVLRMDLDTMAEKDAHLKAFERFSGGEADVLIGTQMITKGFDFENVAVSAVIAADTMLNIPDYRSAEQAFCQITQIAGRAGRKQAGRVILQTYNAEHYAVRYAAKHDYKGFFAHETAIRKLAQLPPFATLVQVQFSGADEQDVIACVKDFLTKLKTVLLPHKNDIISVRASELAVKRANDMYRYHILVGLKRRGPAQKGMYTLFSSVNYTHKNVLAGIDENPSGMV